MGSGDAHRRCRTSVAEKKSTRVAKSATRPLLLRSGAVRDVSLFEYYQVCARRSRRHAHEASWFSLTLTGSYTEQLGSKRLEHRASSVAFHPAGLELRAEVGQWGARALIVALAGEWEQWLPPAKESTVLVGAEALRSAYRLHRELTVSESLCSVAIDGLTHDLLESLSGSAARGERRRPVWLDRVVERMHAEYADPVSLAAIAVAESVHPDPSESNVSPLRRRLAQRLLAVVALQPRFEALGGRGRAQAGGACRRGRFLRPVSLQPGDETGSGRDPRPASPAARAAGSPSQKKLSPSNTTHASL